MDRIEALGLTERIFGTWNTRGGHAQWDAWVDALQDVRTVAIGDEARTRLAKTSRSIPPIAEFLAICRSISNAQPAGLQHHAPRCHECDGTGWVHTEFTVHNTPPITYSGVRPCRCSRGDQNREVHAGALNGR